MQQFPLQHQPQQLQQQQQPKEKIIALKFLISNRDAGSIIGPGGSCIKEFIEYTGARINVSGSTEVFPGSKDRVVLISGSEHSVNEAQRLMWVMLAQQQTRTSGQEERMTLSAKIAASFAQESTSIPMKGKLAIPAAAGGLILGRMGGTIKQLSELSGAMIAMTGRDEAMTMVTNERVISLEGTVSSCQHAVQLIISKLASEETVIPFTIRDTSYVSQIGGGMYNGHRGGGRYRGGASAVGDDAIPADKITITLTVPNDLVGNIMGKRGVILKEIQSLSNAVVKVSDKISAADSEEGADNNRTITIIGEAPNAQTAHHLIQQKLYATNNSSSSSGGRKYRSDE